MGSKERIGLSQLYVSGRLDMNQRTTKLSSSTYCHIVDKLSFSVATPENFQLFTYTIHAVTLFLVVIPSNGLGIGCQPVHSCRASLSSTDAG